MDLHDFLKWLQDRNGRLEFTQDGDIRFMTLRMPHKDGRAAQYQWAYTDLQVALADAEELSWRLQEMTVKLDRLAQAEADGVSPQHVI